MLSTVGLLVAGLALLVAGAEALVRGASRIALALGVTPLVVGLTVVAYGTSMPELVVSALAATGGRDDLAVGNVVGSNVLNVLLVLGLCAAIAPLGISRQVLRREVPIMIAASLVLFALSLDGNLGKLDGSLLLMGLVAFTVSTLRAARREAAARPQPAALPARGSAAGWSALLVLAGLGLLVLGARWLVEAASALARAAGLSEAVIGLTVVAVGTSFPELATSVVATARGERDIAVGNAVGSNVYNILAILGVAALVAPGPLSVHPSLEAFDIPFATAVAVACLPLFFTERRLARWEGGLFLAYYAAYTVYLVLGATSHDALPLFGRVMWLFVAPLTAVTVAVLALRALRAEAAAARSARGG